MDPEEGALPTDDLVGDNQDPQADPAAQEPVAQFGEQGYVETETYGNSDELVTRRDDGSVVYEGDADFDQYFQTEPPAAPAPATTPAARTGPQTVASPANAEIAAPASIATLPDILTADEEAYFNANPDKWLDAQKLIAFRTSMRSETSMLASNSSYARLEQQAPALMNIIGPSVKQNLANLAPEIRVREDAADIAFLMAIQTEVVNKKGSAIDVMKRYIAVMEGAAKPPAAPPRTPAAPTAPVRRMPGTSPNSPARTQPSRQRSQPTVGVGLGLSPRELAMMAEDTENLI